MKCPYCKKRVELVKARSHFRFGRSDHTRFEQTVQALKPWESVPDRWAPPAETAHLEPGETRDDFTYQPRGREDVIASALAAACSGVASLVGTGALAWIWEWPWQIPPTVSALITSTVFLVPTFRTFILGKGAFIIHEQTMSRAAPPLPQTPPKQRAWHVEGQFEDDKGCTVYPGFDLDNPWNWYRFCRAVIANDCNFSGRAAKEHGLKDEWPDILQEFEDRDFLEAKATARGTNKLNRAGKNAVRFFASTPPPD